MTVKRVIWWVSYVAWFGMLVVLFSGALETKQGELRAPEELLRSVHLKADSSWMGVYLGGRKIGYIHTEVEPLESGYEVREFSRLAGAMMGTGQVMLIRMTVTTDSSLAMVSFDGSVDSQPYGTSYEGEVVDNVLSIRITTAGKTTERFIPAPEPLYMSQVIKPLMQAGRLGEGDSLRLASFDPMSLQMQDLVIKGGATQEETLWGEKVKTRKLITRMAGFESEIHVDEEGNSLVEHGPMGIMMRREDMETALTIDNDGSNVDFLAIYAVKPEGRIDAPRKVVTARYKLTNVDIDMVGNSSDRQRVIDNVNGIIEVRLKPAETSLTKKELKEYTGDAPFIESRDPLIVHAAASAVVGAETLTDSLDMLSDWVSNLVRKRPAAGIPSALAVLRTRSGDCNEHSVLFTALARSLGIPSRIHLGIVYQNERFYYHAWPSAWVNGRWIEYDPTFGLKRADAARISLTSGDMTDAVDLVTLIGHIGVKILDAN